MTFDADRPTVPYTMIEGKQATAKGGKEQLKSYTHATGAPLAVWSDVFQPPSRWNRPHFPTQDKIDEHQASCCFASRVR